jgi:hypothetical protein
MRRCVAFGDQHNSQRAKVGGVSVVCVGSVVYSQLIRMTGRISNVHAIMTTQAEFAVQLRLVARFDIG